MSDSPEYSRANYASISSASSSNNGAPQAIASDDKATQPIEKTISCVSCRKRKLKCDRIKPKCGTCTRLRHECEYPERRRNVGSKRRNMKELEARLAEVETRLVSETSKNTPPKNNSPSVPSMEPDWNNFPMDMNVDFGNDALMDFPMPETAFTYQPEMPTGDFFSQEIISLGLEEPLPPDEMIRDLHDIYFKKFHTTMPMIHKWRYLAALNLPAHMRPPICLRYAIWATAASDSEKYIQYEDVLYKRARKYVDQAEMKGFGETFVTIQHAQTWCLISNFEAKKTYFTRAWMSTGRFVRLCHMLGLHRLDGDGPEVKRILPPPKDWTELEERRRTFWASFYCDRWASSGTGWPMVIDEKSIMTNLPSSEEAFEQGIKQDTVSLKEALTIEGASKISPFGGVVLSACLFGHNFEHLHQNGSDEHPEDLANGEFWKRHRKMDNVLSNTFMFLPDHLRLPYGLRNMNIAFLHMNIHASTICLHQAAVLIGEKHRISPTTIKQSLARSLMAAEEITNIMRLISHVDCSHMNAWMGFCLYVAAGVFIQDQRRTNQNPHSKDNLEFIVTAMKAMGNRHTITQHFLAQVEIDVASSGINKAYSFPCDYYPGPTPPQVMEGLKPAGSANANTMNIRDLFAYAIKDQDLDFWDQPPLPGILPYKTRSENREPRAEAPVEANPYSPHGIFQAVSENDSPETTANTSSSNNTGSPADNHNANAFVSSFPEQQNSSSRPQNNAESDTFYLPGVVPFIAGKSDPNIPPQRNPNKTQYPYRQADPSNLSKVPYSVFPADANDKWTFLAQMPNGMCPFDSSFDGGSRSANDSSSGNGGTNNDQPLG